MENNIFNEQTAKLIDNKFFLLLNQILPGFFVLELFFNKGLFSKIPESIYEFLIYLIRCFLFSMPYRLFLNSFSLKNLADKMKNDSLKNEKVDKLKYLKDYGQMIEDTKEENTKSDSIFEFLYIMIYLVLTFIIYKVLVYNFVYYPILKINIGLLILVNTLLILYVVYFILIKPFTNYIKNLIVLKRHNN